MNCDQALEQISAALDGELSAAEQRALEEHLSACPACAALMEELSGQSLLLRELDCQPPADLSQRVLDSLPPQWKRKPIVYLRRYGALAACLVLAVYAGVALPGRLTPAPDPASLEIEGNNAFSDSAPADNSLDATSPPMAYSSLPAAGSEAGQNALTTGRSAEGQVQYLQAAWSEDIPSPAVQLVDSGEALADCLSALTLEGAPEAASYDDGYFAENALLAVTLTAGSGSTTYEVTAVDLTEEGCQVTITRYLPELGTCDMAAWLILIETNADLTQDSTITLVLQDQP